MLVYKVIFFIPQDQAEPVKQAMFKAGAGRVGDYDCCAFETPGMGQFQPLEGSSPFIGRHGQIERVSELRVEMVCENQFIKGAISALRETHPYEEPAFDVLKLEDF